MKKELIGYCDRLSAAPGERIQFMVSADLPSYSYSLVRLIHGDENPEGPGFKEEMVEAPMAGRRKGRKQIAHAGSFVAVEDCEPLRNLASFTLQAWIYPTTPAKGQLQGLVSKWSTSGAGFRLAVGREGALEIHLGGSNAGAHRSLKSEKPLRAGAWYFVTAVYDADNGKLRLCQQPLSESPPDDSTASVEKTVVEKTIVENSGSAPVNLESDSPLLFAAGGVEWKTPERAAAHSFFNGKIDSPRIFRRALTSGEIEQRRQGVRPEEAGGDDLVGAWDFSLDISSARISDIGPHGLHGAAVNMPTRGVTGHNWTAAEVDPKLAPSQYGAIHFHEDDLEDAGWASDFEFVLPNHLKSGIYAARLTAGGQEDHIPFVVRPARGAAHAPILFLVPTFTYLAYANDRMGAAHALLASLPEDEVRPDALDLYLAAHPEFVMSLYDQHADGSGCAFSTRLRPLTNMRPKYRHILTRSPRNLGADLYLVDWLEQKQFAYDTATDEDLHHEGEKLLENYSVILTGTHPEYWTAQMMATLESYLAGGGRLIYLGGNGFYWVTSVDPERPHLIEVRRGLGGTRAWNSAPGECYHSTTGELGGLWRHRGKPPNLLAGVGFTAQGWGDPAPGYKRQPGSFDERAAFIFEGVNEDETIGDFGLVFGGAAGDELDRLDFDLGTPPHALLLASSFGHGPSILPVIEDFLQVYEGMMADHAENVRADMVYFETPNNGAVFSVGSICWCGSLSHNGYDNNVSRITENVLRAFATATELPPVKAPSGDSRL